MYNGSERHLANLAKNREKINSMKKTCQYCQELRGIQNIKKHEDSCYLNPSNLKLCLICEKPLKYFRKTVTCSHACSNMHFRTGPNHGNWKESQYQTTCFHYHEKKCIICDEVNVVEVHHLDENRENNHPSNLAPLCPTHHRYWHSKFKHLVEGKVLNYMRKWSG